MLYIPNAPVLSQVQARKWNRTEGGHRPESRRTCDLLREA